MMLCQWAYVRARSERVLNRVTSMQPSFQVWHIRMGDIKDYGLERNAVEPRFLMVASNRPTLPR